MIRTQAALPASLTLVLSLSLAGCGGGGGGGGGSVPPPPPPPPPASGGSLTIDRSSMEIVTFVISAAESVAMLGQASLSALLGFVGPDGGELQDCGGTREIVHVDNDADFEVTPGDRVDIIFTECIDEIVLGTVTGTLVLDVTAFSASTDRAAFEGVMRTSGQVTVTDPGLGVTTTVSGEQAVSFEATGSEILTVTATDSQSVVVSVAGVTETFSDYMIMRDAQPDSSVSRGFRTSVVIETFNYDSELFGGDVTCESIELEFVDFASVPASGSIDCLGLDGSRVRYFADDDVSLDAEGDGTFELIMSPFAAWNAHTEGFLGAAPLVDLTRFAIDLEIRRIGIASRDVAYDPTRGRLVIATGATDRLAPDTVRAFDLASRQVETLLEPAQPPALIRVSPDGNHVYVAYERFDARVQRYDAATMTLQVEIDLAASPSEVTEILDIAVSPLDGTTIAVSMQDDGVDSRVVIVSGETQLPSVHEAVPDEGFTAYESLRFADDPTKVLAAGIARFAYLTLDETGIAAVESRRFPSSNLAPTRVYLTDRGVLVGRDLFRVSDLVHLGTYFEINDTAQRSPVIASDPVNGLLLGVFDEYLHVNALDRYLKLGTFELAMNLDEPFRDLEPAGDTLVLARDTEFYLIEVADLATRRTTECQRSIELTVDGEEYIQFADCPVRDIVYDAVRGRIYASLAGKFGDDGNSVAIIDSETLEIVETVFVGDNPGDIEISGDGARLYVGLDGADRVAVLELDTLTHGTPLDVLPGFDGDILEPRSILGISASPVEPRAVAVEVGVPTTSTPFDRIAAYRDGTRLPDEVLESELAGTAVSDRAFEFDASGILRVVTDDIPSHSVEGVALSSTGLTPTSLFTVDVGGKPGFAVANDEVFLLSGIVANLSAQTGDPRFDFDATTLGEPGARVPHDVVVDATADEALYLVNLFTAIAVLRFDSVTGALVGEEAFDRLETIREMRLELLDARLGIIEPRRDRLTILERAIVD